MKMNVRGMHYRDLNQKIREAVMQGEKETILEGVNGQRYIGGALNSDTTIVIQGVPGNDLAAFMKGPTIRVRSNAQDGVGNTMDDGKVIVERDAGDILGYAMRGGKIFVQGSVGYRAGIHMKSFRDKCPVIVIGAAAGDFLGEYMAGGTMVVLGLGNHRSPVGRYVGTGMHGGVIYVREEMEACQLGREVRLYRPNREDLRQLRHILEEYCRDLGLSLSEIMRTSFFKLAPHSSRPYGQLYAY